MVHQHFMLIDSFTVLENLVLGAEGGLMLAGGLAAARAELARLARDYGLTVDPDALIADLSVGEQQRVEILKVLFRGARILILDEPSAVLTPQETDQLFRILATLKERGVTVVLITHKLREIMAATDRVFVMRQGQMVAERRDRRHRCRGAGRADGRPQGAAAISTRRRRGGARCCSRPSISSLVDERGVRLLDDIGLELRAGEIVGIAGVSGNGQTELLQVLAGIRGRAAAGSRSAAARSTPSHPGDPAEMRDAGRCPRAGGPAAPGHGGGVPRLGDLDPRLSRAARRSASTTCSTGRPWAPIAPRLMERFDVRPRAPGLRSSSFSGGNQQKLVLAREMARDPKVLLVGQPTRGVDIGAIEFIHRELVKSRDAGCAVLVVSVELDEILSLADRILVMFAGRIVGEVEARPRRRAHARPDDGGSRQAA